ncbi:MAG: hypothetical protein JKY82_10265 [Rhizobiaceae bacterium]|nr:hypothetical protein [Rhizobiaceae bacterium]
MRNSKQHNKSRKLQSVLLLGNYRPTLVLAGQLRERGYWIIAGLDGCDRGAEHSTLVDEIWDHPSVVHSPQQFQSELNDLLASRAEIEVVIPVAEEFVRYFVAAKHTLPAEVNLAMSDARLVDTCLDKVKMLHLAAERKVPIAPFKVVRNLPELIHVTDRLGFPLVIRPLESTKRLFDLKAVTLDNALDLANLFAIWPSEHTGLLVQRKADGIRHNIYFAAKHGKLFRYLHSRIDRTDRLDGSGLAVDGITIEPLEELQHYTSELVGRLNYSGIGCAQFLVDETTNKTAFLEINPRIAGNHAVPEYCGLGLGAFLLDLNNSNNLDNSELVYGQTGVRYSWVAGDMQGLKMAWRNSELNVREVLSWAGKIFATAWCSELDMMINRRDPMPGLVSLINVIPGMRHLTRNYKARQWVGNSVPISSSRQLSLHSFELTRKK